MTWKWKTVTLVAALSGCAKTAAAFEWPFSPKRFTGNSMLEAGPMGITDDVRVIAFGDFNGDQFLDVLALGPDQQELYIYLWDNVDFMFKKASQFRHPQRVFNAVPGDFTQDGVLDLLVMAKGSRDDQLDLKVYVGKPGDGLDMDPLDVPPSSTMQPVPFDANGDMKIDLLGLSSGMGRRAQFKLWRNIWNASLPASSEPPLFEVSNAKFNGASCKLANPHSNAVIDLDGDCLADLFLICDDGNSKNQHFQIWLNGKDAGFTLAQSVRLPAGTQSFSFADVDRDGTIDLLFMTCASVSTSTGVGTDCALNIAYNRQLPLCSSSTAPSTKHGEPVCRPPDALCSRDPNFRFDLSVHTGNDAFVSIPVADLLPAADGGAVPGVLVLDTTFDPPLPLPLRLGDTDLDGFPDLMLIAVSGSGDKPPRTPKLLQNVPCTSGGKEKGGGGAIGCATGQARGWRVVHKGVDALEAVTDARGTAFLDMGEDGTLDVMVQRTGDQGAGHVLFVQNNFFYDAFFMKAIVLNGACQNGWCSKPNSSSRYHPYGVSYSGATFKYTVVDTTGRRSAAQVAQLPQTGYHALQTPYAFFGLGRTNNYLENLFAGSTKHSAMHFVGMEGVVPNSRLVIIPAADADEGAAWRKELYLRPGDWIPWVTLTVAVATIMLAGVVAVLHLGEKRADELERRKASHHINFDAL